MLASKTNSAASKTRISKIKQHRHSASHAPRPLTPTKREHARRRSTPHNYHRHSSPRASNTFTIPSPKMTPEYLAPRPVTFIPSPESVASVDPVLVDVPLQYIRDKLHASGERLLHLAHCTRPTRASKSKLPSTLDVRVDAALAEDTQPPTHILAVHGGAQSGQPKKKITLHPVHSLVYAAHTTRLTSLPASDSTCIPKTSEDEEDATAAHTLRLPVTPIRLPAPDAFAPLNAYLYTHRADVLLASLILPSGTTSLPACAPEELPRSLARTLTRPALVAALHRIRGVQLNALALGVCDEEGALARALDVAWRLARGALLAQA